MAEWDGEAIKRNGRALLAARLTGLEMAQARRSYQAEEDALEMWVKFCSVVN